MFFIRKQVCVVGLGKLGLPLLAVIRNSGYPVIGYDRDFALIENLSSGQFSFSEPGLNNLLLKLKKSIKFTNKISDIGDSEIFLIIVPTPSDEFGNFINDFVVDALSGVLKSLENTSQKSKTIVIVSTVMPGSCDNVFKPLIKKWSEKNNYKVQIKLLYSPEFIALGSVIRNLQYPDTLLVGAESETDATEYIRLSRHVAKTRPPVRILNYREAEFSKLLVNCYVTMKISFANFIGEISDKFQNLNPFKITESIGLDSRIGNRYLMPGAGYGGPCFPRDGKALISSAKEIGLVANLAIATEEINLRQTERIIKKIENLIQSYQTVGIIGLSYKPGSDVVEESQMVKVAELLVNQGKEFRYFDPLVKSINLSSRNFKSVDDIGNLYNCDVIVSTSSFIKFLGKDFLKLNSLILII